MNLDHELVVALANRADAREIALISRDYIEAGLGWSWTPLRVSESIRDPETTVVIARARRMIAGFAIMRFGHTRAHLNLLAVRPAYQRQGLGRHLIVWLENSARVAGTFNISLELVASNAPARRFYECLGYQQLARIAGYYRNHTAALRMAKCLRIANLPASGSRPNPF